MWCDGTAVAAVSCGMSIFRALPGKETFAAHQPGNAITSARTTQNMSQAWAAVGLTTTGELLADPRSQESALDLARTGSATPLFPVVIAAA